MSIEDNVACILPAVLLIADTVVLLSGLKPASISELLSAHATVMN